MMEHIARFGDIVIADCYCHIGHTINVGIVIPAQRLVSMDGRNVVRCFDISVHSCGHVSIIVTCSLLSIIMGLGAAGTDSFVIGCSYGFIGSGSPLGFLQL